MLDERELTKLILNELKQGQISKDTAVKLIEYIRDNDDADQVAIIGMGCMLPGIDDYRVMWEKLLEQEDMIDECPSNRVQLVKDILGRKDGENIDNYHNGSFFERPDLFDYLLFEITKEEANVMNPGQRIMLMTAFRALEDAGYLGEKNYYNDTVVCIGNNFTVEFFLNYLTLCGFNNFEAILRNWSSGIATRVSNYFDFKGMSLALDNSCASGATAIINAARMIKNGECTTALAGGINLFTTPDKTVTFDWVFNHGKNSVTRPFDKNSEGMYFGEGCAALFLKSLKQAIKDGDRIHAVIRGSAINNNGKNGGFANSSVNDVKEAMVKAISNSKINVQNLGYLESEGYVEKLEEAIQFRGMSDGIHKYTTNKQFCAIGAISPNVGYLQAATGPVNAIKCIMALKEKKIPPLHNFLHCSDMINYVESAFYLNVKPKEWKIDGNQMRIAATYAYGFGGNNIITFYEEFKEQRAGSLKKETKHEIFLLSANSIYSFNRMIDQYIKFLENTVEEIKDICYTASVGRRHYLTYRCAIIAIDKEDLLYKLKEFAFENSNKNSIWYASEIKMESSGKRLNLSSEMERAISNRDFEKIAELYCKGSDGKYNDLYKDGACKICSLPMYEFDLSSCWVNKTNF